MRKQKKEKKNPFITKNVIAIIAIISLVALLFYLFSTDQTGSEMTFILMTSFTMLIGGVVGWLYNKK